MSALLTVRRCSADPGRPAPTLLVMLACAYGRAGDFEANGFVATLREGDAPPDIDLAFVETDLSAVPDGSIVERLHEQLVLPARAAGHARIITGGISIGGLVALAHADRHPGAADGLCLIAPYPGNRVVTREIAAAGGVARWDDATVADNDMDRCGWRALKRLAADPSADAWLGWGRQDRFAAGHRLMHDALGDARACAIDGDHDWSAWQRLWAVFACARLAPTRIAPR